MSTTAERLARRLRKIPVDQRASRYVRAADRRDVLAAGRCAHCGATERLVVDHVIPVREGGTSHRSNLQALCGPCNRRKW